MFDGQPYRDELIRRLDAMRRILDAAHPEPPLAAGTDASREARGLVILLLFAAYENLLTSLCRRLLEMARNLGVGNRTLRRGFLLFAIHSRLKALSSASEAKIWRGSGLELLDCAFDSEVCTINPDLFPADGTFMKRSQVELFCDVFELGHPGRILLEVWDRLDTVVAQRNGIAHGRLTPEEVGRGYSVGEVRGLVDLWESRWVSFIRHIESQASDRGFFRCSRLTHHGDAKRSNTRHGPSPGSAEDASLNGMEIKPPG